MKRPSGRCLEGGCQRPDVGAGDLTGTTRGRSMLSFVRGLLFGVLFPVGNSLGGWQSLPPAPFTQTGNASLGGWQSLPPAPFTQTGKASLGGWQSLPAGRFWIPLAAKTDRGGGSEDVFLPAGQLSSSLLVAWTTGGEDPAPIGDPIDKRPPRGDPLQTGREVREQGALLSPFEDYFSPKTQE